MLAEHSFIADKDEFFSTTFLSIASNHQILS